MKDLQSKHRDYAATHALDRKAMELLAAGVGHTLQSAYQQAMKDLRAPVEKRGE